MSFEEGISLPMNVIVAHRGDAAFNFHGNSARRRQLGYYCGYVQNVSNTQKVDRLRGEFSGSRSAKVCGLLVRLFTSLPLEQKERISSHRVYNKVSRPVLTDEQTALSNVLQQIVNVQQFLRTFRHRW